MDRFKAFLKEARKYPDLNPRISIVDKLRPFKDKEDIYISFTAISKVGINPKSGYATPIGIYAYPLKYIWREIEGLGVNKMSIPFASGNPFIHVLKAKKKGFIDNIADYSNAMYKKDVAILRKMYKDPKIFNLAPDNTDKDFDEVMAYAESYAYRKDAPTYFWNLTRLLAERKSGKQAVIWNWILRELGYTGFADKAGIGIIHGNEPTQAVFLSKKAFDVVDMLRHAEFIEHQKGQK